jgi:hypothetical protein
MSFFCSSAAQIEPRSNLFGLLDNTQLMTPGRTPLNERSVRLKGRYLHNTKQTKEMKTRALSGIQKSNSNNEPGADVRHRPHGNRNQI